MSIIKLPLLYLGSEGEKRLYTFFDSGPIYPVFILAVLKDLSEYSLCLIQDILLLRVKVIELR